MGETKYVSCAPGIVEGTDDATIPMSLARKMFGLTDCIARLPFMPSENHYTVVTTGFQIGGFLHRFCFLGCTVLQICAEMYRGAYAPASEHPIRIRRARQVILAGISGLAKSRFQK